jgi:hypothetical protein
MIAPLSRDQGQTWDYEHRVLTGWSSQSGDCGYSSVAQLPDGTIVSLTCLFGATDLPGGHQAIAVRSTERQMLEAGQVRKTCRAGARATTPEA